MASWQGVFRNLRATALFASPSPPRAESFSGLVKRGIVARALPPRDHEGYAMELRRKGWGRVVVRTEAQTVSSLEPMFRHDTRLSSDDVDALSHARSRLDVELVEGTGDPLADRKALFRFVDALLGDDDPGLVDTAAQRFWSMEALDDELGNEASLDVSSLFTAHAITTDRGDVAWLHSHGLGEIGLFDFDIVRPARHVVFDATGANDGSERAPPLSTWSRKARSQPCRWRNTLPAHSTTTDPWVAMDMSALEASWSSPTRIRGFRWPLPRACCPKICPG